MSVGPPGARFNDVTMDFTGPGGPGVPSPASLLQATNGNGKTVWLTLLFSVPLPGKNSTVGGTSLADFVAASDVSHVALEWVHAKTGHHLVTAKVMARSHRSGSSLDEVWYTFHPVNGLGIESLPFLEDGKLRTIRGYRSAVEELTRHHPSAEVHWDKVQRDWMSHLRGQGLEPGLFDIQRRMNLEDGGAGAAFRFKSSNAFVDWLVQTSHASSDEDPADSPLESAWEVFSTYSEQLAKRGSLVAERDFLDHVLPTLGPTSLAATKRGNALGDKSRSVASATRLAGALGARLEDEKATGRRLEQEKEAATRAYSAQRAIQARASEIATWVKVATLTLELAALTSEAHEVDGELTAASLTLKR